MITNKCCRKEKLLENEKDLEKQNLSSKPAKAAETSETVEAAVQKTLTQNIPTSSQQNYKSKIAKPPFYLHWDFRIFWHSPVWKIELDFFLLWTGKKFQFGISSLTFILNL